MFLSLSLVNNQKKLNKKMVARGRGSGENSEEWTRVSSGGGKGVPELDRGGSCAARRMC